MERVRLITLAPIVGLDVHSDRAEALRASIASFKDASTDGWFSQQIESRRSQPLGNPSAPLFFRPGVRANVPHVVLDVDAQLAGIRDTSWPACFLADGGLLVSGSPVLRWFDPKAVHDVAARLLKLNRSQLQQNLQAGKWGVASARVKEESAGERVQQVLENFAILTRYYTEARDGELGIVVVPVSA